jgi:hypothetical protein
VKAFGRTWRRVWQEDECLRNIDGETVGEAWQRFFAEPMPATKGAPMEDWGDAYAYRLGDRVVVYEPGGAGIWVTL